MTITPTSQNAIDEALGVLQANKDAWVTLSIDERIAILDEIKHDMIEVADRWIAASINAKGIPALSNGEGEEWVVPCRSIPLCATVTPFSDRYPEVWTPADSWTDHNTL
jgi:acyl-CoA reductase-like NAD-dependent aldehyde dehydrogenase